MKVKFYHSLICLLILPAIQAQQGPVALQSPIDEFVNYNNLSGANISIAVVDLEENQIIAGHRAQNLAIPASSLKVITTLTGLMELGDGFRFKTYLEYDGNLRNDGTLEGDLYIRGGGDPGLGGNRYGFTHFLPLLLEKIVTDIRKAGINCITGKLIADASIFDNHPVAASWQWADIGNYYAGGAWGLNVHENMYYLHFINRQKRGARPDVELVEPAVPGLYLSNEIVTAGPGTGDRAYIHGGPLNFRKRIVGSIPQGQGRFTIKGSIPDPPLFFIQHLKDKFTEENIQVSGLETTYQPAVSPRKIIAIYKSASLKEILKATNAESLNLEAECIFKMLGAKATGKGSFSSGSDAIMDKIKSLGIKTEGLRIVDGSGLSSKNMISSQTIALFLAAAIKESGLENILDLLPRGGYDGSVERLFEGSRSSPRGHVWLKSGSMSGVLSYSGILQSSGGEWLSFSVIVNGYSDSPSRLRRQIEQLIIEWHEAI